MSLDAPRTARQLREEIHRLEAELGSVRLELRRRLQSGTEDLSPRLDGWHPPESSAYQSGLGLWSFQIEPGTLSWSPRFFAILGYDPAVDRATTEALFALVAEEDRRTLERVWNPVTAGSADDPVRIQIRRPDGEPRELLVDSMVLWSAQGEVVQVLGTVLDLTDSLISEAYQHRQQEHFDLTQRVAGVGSWTLNLTDQSIEWSRGLYRICGVDPSEVPTLELYHELIHPADRPIVARAEREFWEYGESRAHEYRIRRRDGTERHVYTSGVGLKNEQGGLIGFLGITMDITERKALEARFAQAVKMEALGRLAGGVAHDFNNLLTVINGYCELLGLDEPGEELTRIHEAAEAASRLTQRLLQFSRQSIVSVEVLDINRLLERSTALLRRIIGEDIDVVLGLTPDLWQVSADVGQMEQILFNLAANSRDAMPDGGTLTIETKNVEVSSVGQAVELTISDTGVGMAPEVLENAFEPFYTTKEREKGTGLGLSTVFGVVTQSDGVIRIDSELGQGTIVRILLPRCLDRSEELVGDRTTRGRTGPLSIMVVEDDARIAELLRRILRSAGHQVLAATRPSVAIERFQKVTEPVDLLVSDVVMPEMAGPMLQKELRRLQPDLDVLFISGYPAGELDLGGGEGSYFLAKPFTPEEFLFKIQEITGHSELSQPQEPLR